MIVRVRPFLLIAVFVAVLFIPPAQASEAIRHLPVRAECNESILVPIEVLLDEGTRSWGIDEEAPNGWKISLATQGGSTKDPGHVKWFRFGTEPLNGTVVYYHLIVPKYATGTFKVSGSFQTDGQAEEKAVSGNDVVEVTCDRTAPSGGGKPFYLAPWFLWPAAALALLLVVLLVRRVLAA